MVVEETIMDVKRRDVLKGAAAATAAAAVGAPALLTPTPSYAQQLDAAKKWVDSEFQPSTLTKEQQMAEMEWFVKASQPFKGAKVSCASEILGIHEYESKTLTKAFAEITGIQVNHEMMDEGLIVDKIEVEIQSGRPIYDFWMNDSDFIGTHPRYNDIVGGSLTDFMANEGKEITNPNLDLSDFIGLSFATFTDGKVYQLPDQQFANLYWFRYDWFSRPDIKAGFKKQFGYELGVPVNWSAYEDIAEYFTNTVKEVDGQRVYGHMDYGKKDPSLGWRFTDASCPTGDRSTNGAFAPKTAFHADLPLRAAAMPTARPQFMRWPSSSSGSRSTRRRKRPAWTSSRQVRSRGRAKLRSRFSGTAHLPPPSRSPICRS
jgi:glycerol transport system substrate-binding protein